MYKEWREFHLCPKVKYKFNALTFTTLTSAQQHMWISSTPNITQIGQEMWKVQLEINLGPKVKFCQSISLFSQKLCLLNNNLQITPTLNFVNFRQPVRSVADTRSQTG
jgi:hypothetical protein